MNRLAETEVRPSEHKGWVLQWKTPPMPAPAFAYYTTEFEARSHEAVIRGTASRWFGPKTPADNKKYPSTQ